MGEPGPLALVATCALGLEELLDDELAALGAAPREGQRGAVRFGGGWHDCWRANWRLRTANRVLIEIASWPAADGAALAAGARALAAGSDPAGTGSSSGLGLPAAPSSSGPTGAPRSSDFPVGGVELASPGLDLAALFHPDRSFAIQATATASRIRDARWAALSTKDGLVDGQRERWGRRADVDRASPDLHLRLRLHEDRAALLLDSSGEPLDRRGYRVLSTTAPLREPLAAACVLASGWDGRGAVVDPMCGSATLLVEAGWIALGIPPGRLRSSGPGSPSDQRPGSGSDRRPDLASASASDSGSASGWAFERLPGFDPEGFAAIRAESLPAPGPGVRLVGNDRSAEALRAARANLERAGLRARAQLIRGEAAACRPPAGRGLAPGLVVVNPPYGERAGADAGHWRALGDLLKQHFRGWRAAVLAGGEGLGKQIGLRPRRRLPVKNGPLDARILIFDLF
jgi:23S rRNA G2445 N2-methylase RlmL